MKRERKSIMLKKKLKEGGIIMLIGIVVVAILYGISWIATCGVIKLITLCFGWTFKWSIATGIWLIMCIAKNIFSTTVEKD